MYLHTLKKCMKAGSVMFNIFKKRVSNKKPVIIAIHGFGRRRTDEYLNFIEYFNDYEVITPTLFYQDKSDDIHWYNWVSRAEEAIIKVKNQNREIILVGYSMGGVIATYLASKFKIKKLFLIAPAFEYMTITTVSSIFKKPVSTNKQYVELPSSFTSVFMDVVNNCRDAISKVSCPITIFHCVNDEVISYSTSMKYYKKISHDDKRLIIYGDGSHHLMDDDKLKELCFSTIRQLIES